MFCFKFPGNLKKKYEWSAREMQNVRDLRTKCIHLLKLCFQLRRYISLTFNINIVSVRKDNHIIFKY